MKHTTKALQDAVQLREEIESILADTDGWRGYEEQRRWLRKLLQREIGYSFTENERKAVRKIARARTWFEGWDGCSVQELVREARSHMADFDYDDFLNEIEHATRLVRGDMGTLVGLCRMSMDLLPFGERSEEYEDA
ncbi:hypothetical protein [uncultured Bradyrhizobium sp.]|uniref:hypothetical protein n=1 Tax=uncultured Bradyrhizobium sp. TaxID=199684 RepID=UPI0026111505|nr:hypothetical protein [uncultured Bradyrhizobium sp.]